MTFIVVKHPNDSGKYLFQVPDGVELDPGTMVSCETNRGIQPGICATGVFRADPEVVCRMWGTTPERMKRILSWMAEMPLDWGDVPERKHRPEDDDEP